VTAQFLRVFWWQIARTAARHRLLAVCNVLSIALGIAVYLAIQIANASATRAFSRSVDLIAGRAHLEVRGDIDEMLWPEIERQPGVEAVTGLVEALATLPGKPGEYLRLSGIDIVSGEPFRVFEMSASSVAHDAGRWLSTPGGVAITAEFGARNALAVGSRFPVLVNGRPAELTVLAIVTATEVPIDSRFAVMDLGWMQELLDRPGKLSALQIRARDPQQVQDLAAQLQKIAHGHEVRPPRQRSAQVEKMLGAFQLNLTALSMVSLLVGVFLVFNTVSTSVARRRVQIGIIRALGVTPLGVRAMFLGEALLYAVPGIALGIAGGLLLATKLTGAVEKTVTSLYTLVSIEHLALDPWQFVVAAIFGVLAALVGAWHPAAEASRVQPVEALRRGTGESRGALRARRWWIAGACLVILSLVCARVALAGGPRWLAFASAFCVLASGAAFAPFVLGALAALCRFLPARFAAIGLASRRMRRRLQRNAITVGALASAVAMFIALVLMVDSFRRSLDAWIGKGVVADLFVAPAANELHGLNSFLPPEAVTWLRARPEVSAADTFREQPVTFVMKGESAQALLAVVDGAYRNNLTFLHGDEHSAMAEVFKGTAVVATEPFTRRFGLRVGESVQVEGAAGPISVPLAGIYADYSRDQGLLLMSSRLFARLRDDSRAMSVAVYLKSGADAKRLESEFREKFPGEWSINSSRMLRDRILRIFDQTFAITLVLRSVAVVVAIAGVLLTILTMVVERRRELALIRALGATPGFVGRLVISEAALLGFTSALLGIAAGIPLAMVLTWVVNPAFFGWTIQFWMSWSAILWTPVWVTAVAMIAALWPSRVARRIGIADALHEE
jgi:putative ABC transport system permease protein